MTATFLCTIDTGSDTDFLGIADEIREACESKGLNVKEVKPWQRKAVTDMKPVFRPPQNFPPNPR